MADVQGLPRLKRKLHELPEEAQTAIRLAAEEGAREMVGLARQLVPVATGALKNSIDWSYGDPPSGAFGGGRKSESGETEANEKISIYAGDSKAFYARWVEFGTAARSAQPFFFPAYRTLKKSMQSRNSRAIKKAIRKVAAGGQ